MLVCVTFIKCVLKAIFLFIHRYVTDCVISFGVIDNHSHSGVVNLISGLFVMIECFICCVMRYDYRSHKTSIMALLTAYIKINCAHIMLDVVYYILFLTALFIQFKNYPIVCFVISLCT